MHIFWNIETPLPPLHTHQIKQSIDSWIEKSPTIPDCIILIFLVRFMLVVRPFNIAIKKLLAVKSYRKRNQRMLFANTNNDGFRCDSIRYDTIRVHFVYHLLYVWNYFSECRFTGPPVWQYRYLRRLLRFFCLLSSLWIHYNRKFRIDHHFFLASCWDQFHVYLDMISHWQTDGCIAPPDKCC